MLHGVRWVWKQVLSPLHIRKSFPRDLCSSQVLPYVYLQASSIENPGGWHVVVSFLDCATLLFCKPPHWQQIALRTNRAGGCLSTLCCGAGNVWKWQGKGFVFVVSSLSPASASLIDTVYSQAQPKEFSEEYHIQSGSRLYMVYIYICTYKPPLCPNPLPKLSSG